MTEGRSNRAVSGALAAACLAALAALVALAGPAAAHAEFVGSTPADRQRLAAAPSEVVLTFTEPVTLPEVGLAVLDRDGERIDDGSAGHPAGRSDQVRVGLPGDLPAGAYLVTWRVVSADSHPIRGAFSFAVGDAGALSAQEREAIAGGAGGRSAGVLLGAARWAGFAGLAVLVGGLVFLAVCWPAGRAQPGPVRLVAVGGFGAASAGLAEFLLEGPYVAGRPAGDLFDPALLEQTLGTRFGVVVLLRVVVLAALAAAVPALLPGPVWRTAAVAALAAAGLPVTWALAGHAGTGIQAPVAVVADSVHLAAMSVWVGGLALLAVFALRPRGRDGAGPAVDLGQALARFSRLAFTAVVTLAATGTYQGWRQVGTLDALPATAYGRLLLVKVSVFVVLVALGNLARRFVWADVGATPAQLGRLRRSVAAEVLLAAVVLAVTAALVASPPPRASSVRPVAASQVLPNGDIADVTLAPARVGDNDIRLSLRGPNGEPRNPPEVTGSLRLPARDLGPLSVALKRDAPGAYAARGAAIPFAGTWQLAITVRVSEFDAYTITVVAEVR